MDFGHALAVKFPFSRWISNVDGRTILTGTFKPQATGFFGPRYGAQLSDVHGFPGDQMQGTKSSVFWLPDLFASPKFKATHPEFDGVVLPPSLAASGSLPEWEQTDLEMAWSPSLGGAYAYLRDLADAEGMLGPKGPVAPNSSPGAPGVPPAALPAIPTPLPPTPLPAPPSIPGLSDADRAELLAILERSLGQPRGAQIAELVDVATSGAPKLTDLPKILPLLGITDPRAAGLVAIVELLAAG
jgi:hypothetical protein